jgi:hypothetical protein
MPVLGRLSHEHARRHPDLCGRQRLRGAAPRARKSWCWGDLRLCWSHDLPDMRKSPKPTELTRARAAHTPTERCSAERTTPAMRTGLMLDASVGCVHEDRAGPLRGGNGAGGWARDAQDHCCCAPGIWRAEDRFFGDERELGPQPEDQPRDRGDEDRQGPGSLSGAPAGCHGLNPRSGPACG